MLENLLQQFGYPAVLLGTFLEGEMSRLLAAYLALRGYLSIEGVVLCAFGGTYASDQPWYFLGRRHGRRILARRPHLQGLGDKASLLLRRHPDLWVLGFRFIYGMRTVMPLAIGLSGYSWRRYLLLDAIGVAIWSTGLGLAAYHLGAEQVVTPSSIPPTERWSSGCNSSQTHIAATAQRLGLPSGA